MSEPTTNDTAPDIPALEKAYKDAGSAVTKATKALEEAAKSGDVKAMLEAADVVKKAQADEGRAKAKFDAATFELRAAERLKFAVEVKEAIAKFVERFDKKARDLNLTGIHVAFGAEGTTVSITDAAKAPGKRTVASGGSRTSNRGNWTLNGKEYTSAELLLEFGGEKGAEAVNKARNWQALGLKFSPGFDAPLKALAKSMGWDGTENRTLTQLPA